MKDPDQKTRMSRSISPPRHRLPSQLEAGPACASQSSATLPRSVEFVYEPPVNPVAMQEQLFRYQVPEDRPVRIYCDGIYDLFHYGHARSLEQARRLFPRVHLIVGVCNDALTHSKKGMTVFNEHERAESLRHCKWVDEIIENAPWTIDQAFLDEHQIDFVAHDDSPYVSGNCADVYQFVKDQGRFLATQRTGGISTSGIITRIVCDYDTYVRRNLERGISAKELNVSFLRVSEMRMQRSMRDFGGRLQSRLEEEEQNVRRNWESTKDEIGEALAAWEARSHDFVKGFVDLFQNRRRTFLKQIMFWRESEKKQSDGTFESLNSARDASNSTTQLPYLSASAPAL